MKLEQERAFTDPVTGEVIMERRVMLPAATPQRGRGGLQERAPAPGFAVVNMETMWLLRLAVKSAATLVIIMEAARQKRMNGGGVKLTGAFCSRHGITRRQARTATGELQQLQAETGWIRLSRRLHSAVTIEITDLGIRQVWHNGKN